MEPEEKPAEKLPGPLVPFLVVGLPEDQPTKHISRVTCRMHFIRERSGEDYQVFPGGTCHNTYEMQIQHKDPAYLLPDKELETNRPLLINFGWVTAARLVCLLNKTHWKGEANPTEEQKQDVRKRIILIGFDGRSYPLSIVPGDQQPLLIAAPNVSIWVLAPYGNPVISWFIT